MTEHRYDLASDNTAGAVPEALEAWALANEGFAPAYGEDEWSDRARRAVQDFFECECEVFFQSTGTASNALAFAHLVRPFEAVLVHESAHVVTDECGAPEFFAGGAKLATLPGAHGKLDPEAVGAKLVARMDVHAPRIKAVSVTCPTEVGTVYRPQELAALAAVAHAHDAAFHLDGARFSNALVSLGVPPADLSWRAGVDVVSFGATKTGLPFGEALVFFDAARAEGFAARHKQAAQLASKARFLTAPFATFLESEAWDRTARHANARAEQLADGCRALGLEPVHPVEANAVFLELTKEQKDGLLERGWHAYDDVDPGGALRLVCSWRTTPAAVNEFLGSLKEVLG